YDRSPDQWQRSASVQLDEGNDKPGCSSLRLINRLDSLGKAFYGHLWGQAIPKSTRHYASGYAVGKSRLESIAQQQVIGWRLRAARLSHITYFSDVASDFYSMSSASLDSTLESTALSADRALLKQRHNDAVINVEVSDGELDVHPRSGTLQGDGPACQMFLEAYHPCLDDWQEVSNMLEGDGRLLLACPVRGSLVDVSFSSYADDVARKTLCATAFNAIAKTAGVSARLDQCLSRVDLAHIFLRADKRINIIGLCSQQTTCAARYSAVRGILAPGFHFQGLQTEEVHIRLQAAQRGWFSFGRFWQTPGTPQRATKIMFDGMVYSPLLSALQVMPLLASHYVLLDKAVLKYGRKLMHGKACTKTNHLDGATSYQATPNFKVWEYLGLVPSSCELTVRRLLWYQTLARNSLLHVGVLASIFGSFDFDETPSVDEQGVIADTANPWALQFRADLRSLSCIGNGVTLLQLVGQSFLHVFFARCEDFCRVDAAALRYVNRRASIPPPGWILPDPMDHIFFAITAKSSAEAVPLCMCRSCLINLFAQLAILSSTRLMHCMIISRFTLPPIDPEAAAALAGRKRQAVGVDQLLAKAVAAIAKLGLKNALEVRELQAATFRTFLANADTTFVAKKRNAGDGADHPAGEPHVRCWAGLVRTALDDPDISAPDKAILQKRSHDSSDPVQLSAVVYVVKIKSAFKEGAVKMHFAVHASAEDALEVVARRLRAAGAVEKRGQAPAGGLEREVQSLLDQLKEILN
ncbi:unnamed protein product, partial [Polarella glacialis]